MDLKKIEELIVVLEKSHAAELTVKQGDSSVSIKKSDTAISKQSGPEKPKRPRSEKKAPAAEAPEQTGIFVSAPMVGIFHTSEDPYREGDSVSEYDIVGTIESMKLLNDVPSTATGRIAEVLVENGVPVEYGQPLYRIEPSS